METDTVIITFRHDYSISTMNSIGARIADALGYRYFRVPDEPMLNYSFTIDTQTREVCCWPEEPGAITGLLDNYEPTTKKHIHYSSISFLCRDLGVRNSISEIRHRSGKVFSREDYYA